jgi:hypothetical protein
MEDDCCPDEDEALSRFELENDLCWLRHAEYSAEAFEEMLRQDAEGLS